MSSSSARLGSCCFQCQLPDRRGEPCRLLMRAHADVRSRDHADARSYVAPSCDLPLDSGEVARLLWTHTTGNDVVKQSEGVCLRPSKLPRNALLLGATRLWVKYILRPKPHLTIEAYKSSNRSNNSYDCIGRWMTLVAAASSLAGASRSNENVL